MLNDDDDDDDDDDDKQGFSTKIVFLMVDTFCRFRL